MDLGFGAKNQLLGEAVSKNILNAQLAQEAAIDEQIKKYDVLLNSSEDTLESIRAKRLATMKKNQLLRQKWRGMGHGTYEALAEGQHGGDCAKAFFDAAKKSERVVVHFHRRTTRICDVFHKHLEIIANNHLETKFVKIDVESGGSSDYLVEKLGIVVMPTILIVKNRKAAHHIRGFDELGGIEDFSTKALEYVLGLHGGIFKKDDDEIPEELLTGYKGVNSLKLKKEAPTRTNIRNGGYGKSVYDDENDDYED